MYSLAARFGRDQLAEPFAVFRFALVAVRYLRAAGVRRRFRRADLHRGQEGYLCSSRHSPKVDLAWWVNLSVGLDSQSGFAASEFRVLRGQRVFPLEDWAKVTAGSAGFGWASFPRVVDRVNLPLTECLHWMERIRWLVAIFLAASTEHRLA